MDDVYNSMSSHLANPDLTQGRLFVHKHPAIEKAYEEFEEHQSAYWEEPWGVAFDVSLEHEGETLTSATILS